MKGYEYIRKALYKLLYTTVLCLLLSVFQDDGGL